MPKYFDIHSHLNFKDYDNDFDKVINRLKETDTSTITVGTDLESSKRAVELADRYEEIYACIGIHPVDKKGEKFDVTKFEELIKHPKVVAIGECGLDYYRLEPETKEKQKAAFLRQIELAYEVKKPLMIHCRQAFADLIDILQATNYKLQPSIVHFFSGTKEDAKHLLDMGFSFSFGGVITFTKDYDEVVRYIPMDRITLETDAPYVTPTPYRGKRNEPLYVAEVAKKIAELKSIPLDEIATLTTQNSRRIFNI